MRNETKSEVGRETLMERIRQIAKDALQNGRDHCHLIRPTRFPQFLPTVPRQHRRTAVASTAHRAMGARPPLCHHPLSHAREDTVMPLSQPHPIPPAHDNARGQGSGQRTGIFADVVGRAALENEEDTVIPELIEEATDAAAVSTRAESPRSDAP